ncbi:hypothetical protein NE865_01825 [Phthorimaea operculella]|nr:hypothetical protein NE865_01825 [Phthorimaea operculella]
MTPLKHVVRLFGLRPNQISAVAVNALVFVAQMIVSSVAQIVSSVAQMVSFVAQMISTFLAGPKRPSRPYRTDDPTAWILNKNSRYLQDLLAAAKNESLPEALEEIIKQQATEEETSCIRLLVCKITPFVAKMQKAVFGEKSENFDKGLKGSALLYRHLPSAEEIDERNDHCERKHRDCDLNDL